MFDGVLMLDLLPDLKIYGTREGNKQMNKQPVHSTHRSLKLERNLRGRLLLNTFS